MTNRRDIVAVLATVVLLIFPGPLASDTLYSNWPTSAARRCRKRRVSSHFMQRPVSRPNSMKVTRVGIQPGNEREQDVRRKKFVGYHRPHNPHRIIRRRCAGQRAEDTARNGTAEPGTRSPTVSSKEPIWAKPSRPAATNDPMTLGAYASTRPAQAGMTSSRTDLSIAYSNNIPSSAPATVPRMPPAMVAANHSRGRPQPRPKKAELEKGDCQPGHEQQHGRDWKHKCVGQGRSNHGHSDHDLPANKQ